MSPTSANTCSAVPIEVLFKTFPLKSITAEIPVVDTETTFLECSMARILVIDNCWALSADVPKVALLVWTTKRLEDFAALARISSSINSKQITGATLA